MPSTTLKRTAATLGVLAGLLAAAAPAGAEFDAKSAKEGLYFGSNKQSVTVISPDNDLNMVRMAAAARN
jgi:hypothetical protein